ncbi:MAG: prepilin-type N-terminal cleavage/methylation domain-containing protein [Candidatus Hinthialibacter antarcticus]|nr:prepilin-type N-terminal cleavage/methylation domain-containing protein [Candidatus Hinthialibacter antarcticus]
MMRSPAFTLIELLVATTITSLVLSGAFFSLSVVLSAYKIRGGKTSDAEIANMIFTRMRTDLASTFISPHGDVTRFVGMDEQNGQFDADTLTFISMVNNPIEIGEGTSDLAEVQYFIDLDDSTPERWLVRRYDATPDDDPFSGGEISLLGPHIISINYEYYDGLMWWPEWNSEADLPIAVNINLGFYRPNELEQEPTPELLTQHNTTIWLTLSRGASEGGGTSSTSDEPGGER